MRPTGTRPFGIKKELGIDLDARTFYGQLAAAAARLFRDEHFAPCYVQELGRPSLPPSQLALMTLLQYYAQCSDQEAVERTAYDLRWCAVLGKAPGEPLCAKSTFQHFRDRLLANDGVMTIFRQSIKEAQRAGLLKRGRALKVALDTKPMLGRGSVKDTYNLLGSGVVQLVEALAAAAGQAAEGWAQAHHFGRYFESSLKGSASIDWSDAKAREAFLTEIVVDARWLIREADGMLAAGGLAEGCARRIREALLFLEQLLLQDVLESTDTEGEAHAEIKKGTAKDRIPSATDPEQRHGRKSKSKLFTGHKAAVVVDTPSGIITDADVLAGNDSDAKGALDQVKRSEENTGEKVDETTGDCAYGDGETRAAFAAEGRDIAAKVPAEPGNGGRFPKSKFKIDLQDGTVTCPDGKTTDEYRPAPNGGKTYLFGQRCEGCPLRHLCTQAPGGRTIHVHPHEAMRAAARAYQETPEGRARLRSRVGVEHALARLGHLGIGQARYFGKAKARFQLLMAAAVANLRRTWNWEGQKRAEEAIAGGNAPGSGLFVRIKMAVRAIGGTVGHWLACRAYVSLPGPSKLAGA